MPHDEVDLIAELEVAWEAVSQNHDAPINDDEPSEALKDEWTYYENLIIRILRDGLQNHPALSPETKANIAEWIRARRWLGDRDTLGRIRRRVEEGIRRSLSTSDVDRYAYIVEYIDRAKQRNPTAKIMREYIRKRMIQDELLKKDFAPEEFQKLVNRLGAQDLFDD